MERRVRAGASIDLDFDAEGNLYVLQHSTGSIRGTAPATVVRVEPDPSRSELSNRGARENKLLTEDTVCFVTQTTGA